MKRSGLRGTGRSELVPAPERDLLARGGGRFDIWDSTSRTALWRWLDGIVNPYGVGWYHLAQHHVTLAYDSIAA